MPFPQVETAKLVVSTNFVPTSVSYTAANGDFAIVTTAASTITVTLPPVAQGGPVTVRKVDAGAGSAKIVTSDSSTIDGVAGATGFSTSTQYTGWTFVSDGSNWFRITA